MQRWHDNQFYGHHKEPTVFISMYFLLPQVNLVVLQLCLKLQPVFLFISPL